MPAMLPAWRPVFNLNNVLQPIPYSSILADSSWCRCPVISFKIKTLAQKATTCAQLLEYRGVRSPAVPTTASHAPLDFALGTDQ